MKRNLIILLVIPILLISCGSDNYKDFMQNTLSENFKNTMCSFKAIVTIPNQGCAGCISESEGFLKMYYSELDSVKFILTKIVSKKILKQKIGDSIFYSPNVFIDSLNKFTPPFFYEKFIYPSIIHLNQGLITHIEFQAPDLVGLNNLIEENTK